MMQRDIIHINIVGFYTAVAGVLNPKLRSYPLVVATTGSARRMVLDISPRAHEAGIRKGMLLDSARRICHDIIVLDPTPRLYERAYGAVVAEAGKLSPLTEPAGPGHVFVDLTGMRRLLGTPVDGAEMIRRNVKAKYGFDASIGVSTNKLVSKVATRVIRPAGLCSIMGGCEEEFMAPLPVSVLPGIERKTIVHLIQFNINIIKEICCVSERDFAEVLGSEASVLYRLAKGIDSTPVRKSGEPPPSVSETIIFDGQTNDNELIKRKMFKATSRCCLKLRQMGLAACVIELSISYSDGATAQKRHVFPAPLSGDLSIFRYLTQLLSKCYVRRVCIRDLTVVLSDLCYPYGQMDLFEQADREEPLMNALDKIRNKYGMEVIDFYGKKGSISI